MAFVNLPALQLMELQQNRIRSIGPNAFMGVPHLLMLNLSRNEISTFEDAGLRGAKSLELLDVSYNVIKSVSSNSLEKMEWLVSSTKTFMAQSHVTLCRGTVFPFRAQII